MADDLLKKLDSMEERLDLIDARISRLEKEGLSNVPGLFELWMLKKLAAPGAKVYADELKKNVMVQVTGKTLAECKDIFYAEREKIVEPLKAKMREKKAQVAA